MRNTKAKPIFRLLLIVLAMALLACGCKKEEEKPEETKPEYTRPADYQEKIVVALTDNFSVTNAAGEVLQFEDDKFKGDMAVLNYDAEHSSVVPNSTEVTVYVEESDSFKFETDAGYAYFLTSFGGARGFEIESIDVSQMSYSLTGVKATYDAYLPIGCWREMLMCVTGTGDLSVSYNEESDTITLTCISEIQIGEMKTGRTASLSAGTHTLTRVELFG